MIKPSGWISEQLTKAKPITFSIYCIVAAFGTYFCMYAFRKPFTAAEYRDEVWLGIAFKTILVTAQVAGYCLSKFIGIRVVSEMPSRYRAVSILGLIAVAEIALLLFAITPRPWNFVWLFVNGLPLGMVFGLVLGFLEGRKVTESLSAGLCASFIVASGSVKSVGRSLIQDYGVDIYWMPFLTGLLFVVPLLGFVFLLNQIPPPTAEDEGLRTKRAPMDASQRKDFVKRHWIGLTGLILIYILLTIIRSLRDDYAVEIWRELGVGDEPAVFAKSEFWVMICVTAINGLAIWIHNNRTGLLTSIGLCFAGFAMVLATIAGHLLGLLSPMAFMILLGFGMYLPYVAFHTTIFERMLAAFREVGTIAFLMYLADAVGYLVYVVMMFFQKSDVGETGFLNLLIWLSAAVSVVSTLLTIFLMVHFHRVVPRQKAVCDGR